MAARRSPGEELADKRRLFERARRDGVSMQEAARRMAEERWARTATRLQQRIDNEREDAGPRPAVWWQRD